MLLSMALMMVRYWLPRLLRALANLMDNGAVLKGSQLKDMNEIVALARLVPSRGHAVGCMAVGVMPPDFQE